MRFPKMKWHFPGKWIEKGFITTAQLQAGFHPTDWQLLSFEKCSYVRPPHSFFSLEESKTGLKKKAKIMQATLNSMYANNSVCVLAKKCLTRFTHLLWIFARAQGWVGHLSDLYQYEYVKPYTNVNIENLKQTRMGSGWADFVKHTTALFLRFSTFLSFWLILPRIYYNTYHDSSCTMYTFIFPPVCPIPHFLLIDTGSQMN